MTLLKPGLFGHDFDLKQVDYSTSTQELCEAFTTPMFGQAKCDLLRGVILDLVAAAQSASLLPDFRQCMQTNRA